MPAIAPQGLRRPTGQLPGGDAPVADVGSFEGIGAAFRSREDLQDLMTQAPLLLKDKTLRLVKGSLLVPTISFTTNEE